MWVLIPGHLVALRPMIRHLPCSGRAAKLTPSIPPSELFIRPGGTYQAERLRPRVSRRSPAAVETGADHLSAHTTVHFVAAASTDLHWAHDTSCAYLLLPLSSRAELTL